MISQESIFSNDDSQIPTLSPETLTLWALSPEEQETAYERWIDQTIAGRVTLTMEQSNEQYHLEGNKIKWAEQMKDVLKDYKDAYDYTDRKNQNQLTESEIATSEAFRTLYPHREPFQKP